LLIATDKTTPSNTTPSVAKERHTKPVSPIYPHIPSIETVVPSRMQMTPITNAILFKYKISLPIPFG